MQNYRKKAEFVLGSMNIQGSVENKMQFNDVLEHISSHDLFSIQETWLTPGKSLKCPGFETMKSNRKPKKKAKRGVDGILVLFKTEYKKGISRQPSNNEKDMIWVKLDKIFFGFESDVYVGSGYRPPRESAVGNFYNKLERDVAKYSHMGDILLLGDLNSRIGKLEQDISFLDIDSHDNLTSRSLDLHNTRNSQDFMVTKQGKELLDLCNKSQLVILNGRKLGDTEGKYTCHKYNGSSVVDIIAASYDLYPKIKYMQVLEPVWYSDHCSLVCALDAKVYKSQQENDSAQDKLNKIPQKFKWDENGANIFEKEISNNLLKVLEESNETEPNAQALKYEETMIGIAKKVLTPVKNCTQTKPRDQWMNKTCFQEQKVLKQTKREFLLLPGNLDHRQKYLHHKKRYKRLLYFTKKGIVEKNTKRIGDLIAKSPNEFWKNVKHLLNDTKKQKVNHISPKGWVNYFRNLLNVTKSKLNWNNSTIEGPLDYLFTKDEIIVQIKTLKNNKSASTSITNEMLKCNPGVIATSLLKLFNSILVNQIYPRVWNISHISALFKAGDPTEASNYRGICVGNAVGKLFNKCVNQRIRCFLAQQKTLPDNCMGFREKIQTEHAMHTLHTMNAKYRCQGKKVYTVFVDFSKFYDTIDHDLLFEKMSNIGITGKLLNVLRSMYSDLEYAVKLQVKGKLVITENFRANIGLKQGCPLSPTLANIFLCDIHQELLLQDMYLERTMLNSISWADDLVFFSLTPEGLKKQLRNLEIYCQRWHLRVNIDKTKCMIFSTSPIAYDRISNFTFNGEHLLFVTTYKYLGIEFQQNGRFTTAIKNRILKAQAALFTIQRVCSTSGSQFPSIELITALFHAKIIPILTYGSSIWAPKCNNTVSGTFNDHHYTEEHIRQRVTALGIGIKTMKADGNTVNVVFKNFSDKMRFQSMSNVLGLNITETRKHTSFYTLHQNLETFHLKFLKQSLEVKRSCSSNNVRFELGAYPVYTSYIPKAVKFCMGMKTCDFNDLIRESFHCAKANQTSWAQGMHFALNLLDLNQYWEQDTEHRVSSRNNTPKNAIRNIYLCELLRDESRKFDFLRLELGEKYAMRSYIKTIENHKHRSTITKLRTKSHCLLEESHTYQNCPNICQNCDLNSVETPLHFIFECSHHVLAGMRIPLLQRLDISENNKEENFRDIMTGNLPKEHAQAVYKVIHEMYEKRQKEDLNQQTNGGAPQPDNRMESM